MKKKDRKRRMKKIQAKLDMYKDRKDLDKEVIIDLLDDAIWILEDLSDSWDRQFNRQRDKGNHA